MAEQPTSLLVWVDAQLPPDLTRWIAEPESVRAVHVLDLGLLTASDAEIYEKARTVGAIVITKDEDFVRLQERRGDPPQIVWLTCGNLSNRALKGLLLSRWKQATALLRAGEALVEINAGRSTGPAV